MLHPVFCTPWRQQHALDLEVLPKSLYKQAAAVASLSFLRTLATQPQSKYESHWDHRKHLR